jgi:hypothetical protein
MVGAFARSNRPIGVEERQGEHFVPAPTGNALPLRNEDGKITQLILRTIRNTCIHSEGKSWRSFLSVMSVAT